MGYVHFYTQLSTDAFVIWSGTLITSRLLIGGSIIFRFQITNTQTVLWPYIISIIQLQQNEHKFKYPFPYSLSLKLPSVGIMVLCRNVTKDDNILCELYADTFREVFDDCETEIWYSNTFRQVVHLNSLSQFLLVTVKQVQKRKKVVNWIGPDNETGDLWCKTDGERSDKPVLGTAGFDVVMD